MESFTDLAIGAAEAAALLVIGHWIPRPTFGLSKSPPTFENSKLTGSIPGLISAMFMALSGEEFPEE